MHFRIAGSFIAIAAADFPAFFLKLQQRISRQFFPNKNRPEIRAVIAQGIFDLIM